MLYKSVIIIIIIIIMSGSRDFQASRNDPFDVLSHCVCVLTKAGNSTFNAIASSCNSRVTDSKPAQREYTMSIL